MSTTDETAKLRVRHSSAVSRDLDDDITSRRCLIRPASTEPLLLPPIESRLRKDVVGRRAILFLLIAVLAIAAVAGVLHWRGRRATGNATVQVQR